MLADLVDVMKKAALAASQASNPVTICFGEVIEVEPLKINIEQKMTLGTAQLVLSRNVTDYDVDMTVEHYTENESSHIHGAGTYNISGTSVTGNSSATSHRHEYKGRKSFKVHNGLKIGENVILIRTQDGQKYVVWDRIG